MTQCYLNFMFKVINLCYFTSLIIIGTKNTITLYLYLKYFYYVLKYYEWINLNYLELTEQGVI